jgi:glycosyltransferase A (GT-A) superfamily protein (DUF2064 family)
VTPAVLVMAKAPVAGRVKTRLGASVGDDVAAELAAACILDTLDACESAFEDCHVALAGDLADAVQHEVLTERLTRWTVHPQRGDGFAQRLVNAHLDVARAAGAPVVQIGMDTPHVSAADLVQVSAHLGGDHDAVLGRADDGGWWVLAVTAPRFAAGLGGVEMSTEHTYVDTLAALEAAGARVAGAAVLRDVDTAGDAGLAAAVAPATRFARLWSQVAPTTG